MYVAAVVAFILLRISDGIPHDSGITGDNLPDLGIMPNENTSGNPKYWGNTRSYDK